MKPWPKTPELTAAMQQSVVKRGAERDAKYNESFSRILGIARDCHGLPDQQD